MGEGRSFADPTLPTDFVRDMRLLGYYPPQRGAGSLTGSPARPSTERRRPFFYDPQNTPRSKPPQLVHTHQAEHRSPNASRKSISALTSRGGQPRTLAHHPPKWMAPSPLLIRVARNRTDTAMDCRCGEYLWFAQMDVTPSPKTCGPNEPPPGEGTTQRG